MARADIPHGGSGTPGVTTASMDAGEPFGRARLQAFLAGYHRNLAAAAGEGRPVAFLQFGGNVREILEALGFAVAYPCIGSILSGVDGTAASAIVTAERAGYGTTACALMKVDLGRRLAATRPGHLPVVGVGAPIVQPTWLICPHSACSTYLKWYEALEEVTSAPLTVLDIPPRRTEGVPEADVGYVVEQLHALTAEAERIAGRRLSRATLRRVLARSRRAEARWVRLLRRTRARPAPFDALAEGTPLMAPVFLARGTAACVDFYVDLERELAARPSRHSRRFRLLFDGAPPWPVMQQLSDEFARWDAEVVVSTYSRIGGVFDEFRHDPADPWRTMALHALGGWNSLDLELRARWMLRWVREFRCDAVVLHGVASCKTTAVGQADNAAPLEAAGLPVLMLQSDLVDARYYQTAQIRNRIDAFFHALGGQPIGEPARWRDGALPPSTMGAAGVSA